MDRKLLNLLCSPDTRQPLVVLDTRSLQQLNAAIAAGVVQRANGQIQDQPLTQALITQDRKQIFRVEDDIPVLLSEEAIALSQIQDLA